MRDLNHHFGHRRIDLPRHDGGSGREGRQIDFHPTGTRPRTHQTKVLGNLRHGGRHFLHEPRDRHAEVRILEAVKEAFSGLHRFTVLFGEILVECVHVPGIGAQTGTNGGAPHHDFKAAGTRCLQFCGQTLHQRRKTFKFLTERQGKRILPAGAAHLHVVLKFHRLLFKGVLQGFHTRDDLVEFRRNRKVRRRRNGVVRRLSLVHVRIGVNRVLALVPSENFIGAVADDFVHVHVDAGVAAALPHVQGELIVKLTGVDFVRRLGNGLADLGRNRTDFSVGAGTRLLDLRQSAVHAGIENHRQVRRTGHLHHAVRLNTVVVLFGNFHFAEAVTFDTCCGHGCHS